MSMFSNGARPWSFGALRCALIPAGNGAQHGGNGLIRAYQFLRPVSLSFFGSRRKFAPQGLDGGQPGACATQQAVIGGIAIDCSDAVLALELGIGDQFTVQTPGGGGFGRARFPD